MKIEERCGITVADVIEARERIQHFSPKTPLVKLHYDFGNETEVYLKLENLHPVGSFKHRGAANTLLSMSRDQLQDGVCTISTGNFGHAMAWICKQLGVECRVIVPDHVPEAKMSGVRRHGGHVVRVPWEQWWSYIEGRDIPDFPGILIHPEGHDEIVTGNGTIALEILEDLPDVDSIIIPYGGGGMTAGMGTVIKHVKRNTEVVTAEVSTGAPLTVALKNGQPTSIDYTPSFVDGIGCNCVLDSVWDIVKNVVDKSIVVSLEEISSAVKLLAERNHVIAEGAGAASTAAMLSGKVPGKKIVCVVSGGNIDSNVFAEIVGGAVPQPNTV